MEKFYDVMLTTGLGDFEVLLYHSRFLRLYWPNHATHRSPKHTKIKLSDILSFLLTLTWIREGLQPPYPPLWLRLWT